MVRAGLGLDEEVLRELGDPTVELRLDDLRQAGWEVTGPRREGDGLTWVRLSKPFATPARMSDVAAELSGPDGPFRDFRLTRTRSFLKTEMTFTGVVDLTHGLSALSDAGLSDRLGDAQLGLDLDGLRQRFGDQLDRAVQVRVDASLPGHRQSWQPQMGQELTMVARSETWNLVPLVPALVALGLAIAALAVAVAARRRRH